MTVEDVLDLAEAVASVIPGIGGALFRIGVGAGRKAHAELDAARKREAQRALEQRRLYQAAGIAANEAARKAGR